MVEMMYFDIFVSKILFWYKSNFHVITPVFKKTPTPPPNPQNKEKKFDLVLNEAKYHHSGWINLNKKNKITILL